MKTIYLVRKNADSVEGRGPMVPQLTFTEKSHAKNYVGARPGIAGKHAKWNSYGEHDHFGDFSIEPFVLCESEEDAIQAPIEKAKQAALAKLTATERKLLGLEI